MGKFKFRAFNKKHKEMVYDTEHFSVNDLNNENEHWTQAMQYTGLKDKQLKEIYEGDLIKITDPFINQEAIGVAEIVFSHDYVGGWVAQSNSGEHLNIGTRTHMISVCGNIYEHPHLLEGES
jgi:uncharacterized phage protein (TIGR01671 family)